MIRCKMEDDEDIALANIIESLQKQTDKEIFIKKVTGCRFDDCGNLPNKKIKKNFPKEISNT